MEEIKGVLELNKAVDRVKELANDVMSELQSKESWYEEMPLSWQESEEGIECARYISEVYDLLAQIVELETIDE